MTKQEFSISFQLVWFLVFGSMVCFILGGLSIYFHWALQGFLTTCALMLLFPAWIIVFSDMLKSQIYHKGFWLASMFIMPIIAVVFYLIQRERLMSLGRRFS